MRYTYLLFLFVFCIIFMQLPCMALTLTINLNSLPEKSWEKYVIVIGQIPDKNEGDNIRIVSFVRVLHGPWVANGTKVPIQFFNDCENLKKGTYLMLLQYNVDKLFIGSNYINLGSVTNYYKVDSQYSPEVSDFQTIIDTARISMLGLKWQRINELFYQMKNRPLIMQYVINVQSVIMNQTRQGFLNTVKQILNNYLDYHISVVVNADVTLINEGGEDGKKWMSSDERRSLFNDLKTNTPKDNPSYKYIEEVLKTFDK